MRALHGVVLLAGIGAPGCTGDDGGREVPITNFDLVAAPSTLMAPARSLCETMLLQARSVRGGPSAYTVSRAGGSEATVPCVLAGDTLTCDAHDAASGEQFHWTIALFPEHITATVALDYDGADDCAGSVVANLRPYY